VREAVTRPVRYFAARAVEWVEQAHALGDVEARRRLATETDNLLAAAERAVGGEVDAPDAVALAVRTLVGLEPLTTNGASSEHAMRLLDRALASPAAADLPARDRIASILARWATANAHGVVSSGLLDEAVALARSAGDRRLEGRSLRCLAMSQLRTGDVEAALATYESAIVAHRDACDPRYEALSLAGLAMAVRQRGDAVRAVDLGEQAVAAAANDTSLRARARIHVGAAHVALGRFDEAKRSLAVATIEAREVGDPGLEANACMNAGIVHLIVGEYAEADAPLTQSVERSRRANARHVEGVACGYRGIARALAGRSADAHDDLQSCDAALSEVGERLNRSLFDSFDAFFDAAVGKLEHARSRLATLAAGVERAPHRGHRVATSVLRDGAELLAAVDRSPGSARVSAIVHLVDSPAHPATSIDLDVRIALRVVGTLCSEPDLVRLATSRCPDSRAAPVPTATTPSRVLLVERDGNWFETPSHVRVDCRRSPVLRRLLVKLARERSQARGTPVAAQALIDEVWRGQRMRHESAVGRLYFAITKLRRLGLRDLLLSDGEGYLLDPETDVRFVER
jgi:tetratricopeptide (TPR) repeat protein